MFCDGYIDTFIGGLGTNPDIPFFGSHVPEYMENANLHFLNETMGY
jgi:hypothetical protein